MIEQTVDNALTGNEAAAAALEMMRATREKLRAEALAREEEQFIADERRFVAWRIENAYSLRQIRGRRKRR